MSDLLLHTKICSVQIYVTDVYEICSIRTNVTYKIVIGLNVCYTRKSCLVSKVYNVKTYVTQGNMISRV